MFATPPPTTRPPQDLAALRAAVMALASRGSLEVTAKGADDAAGWARLVPPGTDLYIAWVPGTPPARLAQVAARIRAAGCNPVPHIAARQLASSTAAADLFRRLQGEAQVTRALLIAGDVAVHAGPYPSSLALIETGLLPRYGLCAVDVAGYPEGHPAISEADLLAALRAKIAAAAAQDLALGVVSQFCFDGAALLDWLRRLRAGGIAAPVRVGVAGPATVRTLLNYGIRCGIGNSLHALGTHGQSLAKLLAQRGPDEVVAALAPTAQELGVAGLHLFTFGGFARSAAWLAAGREGRITIGAGDQFRVGS